MNWKRFLFVQLPAALVLTAALAEGAAWALNDVAPRRHDLDRLVAALDVAKVDAPVVLAGDSVTQDVMKTYRVAPAGQVANLTTNQASGLIGTAFLLRRYLEHNVAPAHVVIASTPEFFAYQPEGAAARTYVTSVFTRAGEQAELDRLGVSASLATGPAVLALEQRIGEKLTGVATARPTAVPVGEDAPAAAAVEAGPVLPGVAPQIAQRAGLALALSPSARAALEDICALSRQTGFALHLLRAPVPDSVLGRRGVDGDAALRAAVAQATAGCAAVVVDDFNRPHPYPDHAFRDADHLRRPGWSAAYARQLAAYVAALPPRSPSENSQ